MASYYNHNIIQWNCRGLKPNFNEINLLLNTENPVAFCLQETFLKDTDKIDFRGYKSFNLFGPNDERASGGVSIIVNEKVPHSSISLNTTLQAVAVRVTMHKAITICSVYLPPSLKLNPADLVTLVQQLPAPFMLLGDFNGHHTLWGCKDTNKRGEQLQDFLTNNNVSLMNDKSFTYLHPATGSYSSIDLSFCSPSLFLDFDWKVGDDLCGSDHFPIFVETAHPTDPPGHRWNLGKADWTLFQSLCEENIKLDKFYDDDDPIATFTNILQDVTEQSIPKTTTVPKHIKKPWFNDEVKEAIRDRKKILREFNSQPIQQNLNRVKIFRAKARRVIRKNKRMTWSEYVSKLNDRTSVKTTWDMIRKIKGKSKGSNVKHLKKNGNLITSKKDIANTLADTFSKNSSPDNCTDEFLRVKQQQEKQKLNFKSNNFEDYNKPFSNHELFDSLSSAHDTAAGPDDIHYQLLKHLPESSLTVLLAIFNTIWENGTFPASWREATVIPIPKPGKDHSDPLNYRPIALTSCICKTMERMINNRLVWYLESNGIITDFQCGFRRQRSTTDHLVRLETFIRETFAKKQHLVAVFFDLEKAYDTTWKHGVMKDLHDMGLRGRLPNFIDNFLKDRQFRVKVGDTLSDYHDQEMGVPQGSILSVTLFSIKINNITKCVTNGVDCSLYVDDFLICYRAKNMATIERQLQLTLNKLHTWSKDNGFKFSRSKTVCMHFCQSRRRDDPDPHLTLGGTPIPVVQETKFLGLMFDRRCTFIPHINYLKEKCLKALNLIRVVANTDWGADRKVLLRLYRSLVRSKLDYGSIIYGSARKSYIEKLDPIHNQGLRLCLGAFRTSPADSLYVEANETSLKDRRLKLSMQYAIKLKSNPLNPAYDLVFKPKYKDLFDKNTKLIPTFGLRVLPKLEEAKINLDIIANYSVPEVPPWTMARPKVLFDINMCKKHTVDPSIFCSKFLEIKTQYSDFIPIYTDGSKDGDAVAAAAVTEHNYLQLRLPDASSIFSAEMYAIIISLNEIKSSGWNKSIIYSDSLSCLQAIQNMKLDNPLILKALVIHHKLVQCNKDVIFCWVPSHVGIRGNEEADRIAKDALKLPVSDCHITHSDFKASINTYIVNNWQNDWNRKLLNKLHNIKPILGEWPPAYRDVRRDEVVLARTRIGHTFLTHSHLLKNEPIPQCIGCDTYLTVRHIFIDCIDFAQVRLKYFNVSSMRELFKDISPKCILDFLKEIKLYRKF